MRTRRGWGLVGGRPWGIWRDSSIPVYRVCCPRQGSRASSAAPSQSSGPGHAAGARQRALGGAGLRPVRTSFFFCSRFPRGPQSQLACDLAAERGFPSTNWDGRLGLSRWGWFRQGAGSRLGGGGAPGLRPLLRGRSSEKEQGEEAEGRGKVGGGVPGWQIRSATSRGCQTLTPQPGRPLARSSPSGSIWRGHPPSTRLCS